MGFFARLQRRLKGKGELALYFEPADMPAVWAYIKERYGKVEEINWSPLCSHITFGKERFLFSDDWDDPRLIAMTRAGDRVLKEIQAKFPTATMNRPPDWVAHR